MPALSDSRCVLPIPPPHQRFQPFHEGKLPLEAALGSELWPLRLRLYGLSLCRFDLGTGNEGRLSSDNPLAVKLSFPGLRARNAWISRRSSHLRVSDRPRFFPPLSRLVLSGSSWGWPL